MQVFQKIIFGFICVALLTLSACGRYSEPSPIEGSGFPHNYPAYEGE